MDRDRFLQMLMDSYRQSYDIERIAEGPRADGLPLAAAASMRLSEEGYLLTRRARLWSADSDESVFFFSSPVLTEEVCRKGIPFAWEQGMEKIDWKGNPNHMRSVITAVFLCDEAEEGAVTAVRTCRLNRSFSLSLRGWMEFHAVCVALKGEQVFSNRYGRDTAKFLETLLHPRKQRQGGGSLLQKLRK